MIFGKRMQLVLLILSVIGGNIVAQLTPIGLGWAKNSVNGKVFRKNSVTSFGNLQYTAYYDSLGNVILAKRELGSETWEVNKTQYTGDVTDAHNSISIAVDGNGYLHMAWDHHGDPLRYCVSVDSGSIEMGEEQSMLGTLESNITYPEFFRMPNGDLIFMYRDGSSGSGNCVINKYNIADKEWTRLHNILIDGEGQRNAYWQSCVDKNGVIHVSWVWRETWDVSSNHDICYAKSTDGGVTWYKSTGEQYTIPITASTAEYVCIIAQNNELMNQTSMYATSDSKPYIASYWTDDVTKRPQYQLIYLDDDSQWQQKTISHRLTSFSLSGGGTKKIPISRPQIMVDESGDKPVVYLIYSDSERESKVSMNVCYDLEPDTIQLFVYDVTDFTVGDWEPSYDIDLWKDSLQMDIFVQRMEQGDGETLGDLPAQPVYIWSIPNDLAVVDTIFTPPVVPDKATDPVPAKGASEISLDTLLTWSSGENVALHKVYLDTKLSDMTLVAETTENSFKPEGLLPNTTYFWRVDEIIGDEVTKGDNWYFRTITVIDIDLVENHSKVNIYPQPVDDILYIENSGNNANVEIFNMLGKKILSVITNETVDVSGLTNGIYFININDNIILKFIKRSRN